MHNVFKDIGGGGVFKDEDALSPEFTPASLPGRENEERELAYALKPAAEGRRPSNVFVHGPSGTGKTATCKRVLDQLKDFSGKPLCVYVNCWQNSTRQSVFSLMGLAVGDAIPRRGLAGDEVFTRVMQHARNAGRIPVVVLDEADRLFFGGEEKVLYDLTRSEELFGVPVATIMISNDSSLLARADARIRSSFSGKEIEFPPYSPPQLKAILQQRASFAFRPGAFDAEAIAVCAARGARAGGDARVAMQALWLAGKNAEARGSSRVEAVDAKEGAEKSVSSAAQKMERNTGQLDDGEKRIVELVRAAGGELDTSSLYAEFEKNGWGSERSVRNYVARLEFKGLVESFRKGTSRVLKLKQG